MCDVYVCVSCEYVRIQKKIYNTRVLINQHMSLSATTVQIVGKKISSVRINEMKNVKVYLVFGFTSFDNNK